MSRTGEVATVAGRLATFQVPQQPNKRRASSTKKKTPSSAVWPHESPSPEDLAQAGFYYKRTAASNDNVSCFLCGKDIDGWEPDDDPIQEHLSLVPDCGWALNVAVAQRISNDKNHKENPMSESLLAARLATFRNAWPHDGKRGWKCTSKKLASAGWTYNPVPEAEDCVQCFFCNCSLDGWEPKDDPWEEHHRRNPGCAFFALLETSDTTKPMRGRKATKPRSSKVSRLSLRSNLTAISDDEGNDPDNDSLAEEGDTILSTASKTANGRKKAAPRKTRATRKTTRGKSVDTAHDVEMHDDVAAEELEERAAEADLLPSKAPAKRATRAKKHDPTFDSSVVEIEAPDVTGVVVKPVRKGRGKQPSTVPSDAGPLMEVHDGATQAITKAQRGGKRGTSTMAKADTSSIVAVDTDAGLKTKASRGKKRGSDGMEKTGDSILAPVEPKQPEIPAKSPKRAAKPLRTTNIRTLRAADEEASRDEDGGNSPRAANQSERTTKTSIAGISFEMQLALAQPERVQQESMAVKIDKHETLQGLQAGELSPRRTPSPQLSDAENQAPSAQTSLQVQRVPLATDTPARLSPSKRNIAGGLFSSNAWRAVDVEAIFSRTPALQAIGQENAKLGDVLRSLSSPEKKMTIEEWMLHNAHVSEDKLRAECERMISLFESEGNRALLSLEGIAVS